MGVLQPTVNNICCTCLKYQVEFCSGSARFVLAACVHYLCHTVLWRGIQILLCGKMVVLVLGLETAMLSCAAATPMLAAQYQ